MFLSDYGNFSIIDPKLINSNNERKTFFIKARIHCKLFFSDYFIKHQFNAYFITFNLNSWNYIKCVKRKPSRTIIGKNEFKRESSALFVTDRVHIF